MRKAKKSDDAAPVAIPFATYMHLVNVMDELAFRGPKEEALMMRVAKAGDINEVMTLIKRRRIYGKKMSAGRDGDSPELEPGTQKKQRNPRKPKGGRRRSDRVVNNPAEESAA